MGSTMHYTDPMKLYVKELGFRTPGTEARFHEIDSARAKHGADTVIDYASFGACSDGERQSPAARQAYSLAGLGLTSDYAPEECGSRANVKIETRFGPNTPAKHIITAAGMLSVMNPDLARAMVEQEMHVISTRYFRNDEEAVEWARTFGRWTLISIGIRDPEASYRRAEAVLEAGALGVMLEATHIDCFKAHKLARRIRELIETKYKGQGRLLGMGNVDNFGAALRCYMSGAHIVKVGMGSGSICTTRPTTGTGLPQATAVSEAAAAKSMWNAQVRPEKQLTIIADGGVRTTKDVLVCLALGADTVMSGSFFARTVESALGSEELFKPYGFDQDVLRAETHGGVILTPNGGPDIQWAQYDMAAHYFGDASDECKRRRKVIYGEQLTPGLSPEGDGGYLPVNYTVAELLAFIEGAVPSAMTLNGVLGVAAFQASNKGRHAVFYVDGGYHLESEARVSKNNN